LLKILIHGINYAPEQIGIGKYTGELAVWLAQRGHSVHVVTAPPYYPDWRVQGRYRTWQYRHEFLDGIDVWRCPLWVPQHPSGITRIIHLLTFAFFSFPILLRHVFWKPDVVMVIEPPLFCAPQAWLTARLSGAKAWLHIQDFEIAAFFGLGFASAGLGSMKKIITSIEGCLMRRFDRVSSISNAMIARITHLKVPRERTVLFSNWVDTKHICPNNEGWKLRSEWGLTDDQKVILYSGNIAKKQGLEMIINVAAQLEATHPHVIFLLVGEGAAKAELVADAKKKNLKNVLFKELQPLEKLPAMLTMADLHLIVQKRGAADAVMPSKLTGVLSAGGFSIITADEKTELGELVLSNPGIAVLVEPENPEALKKALLAHLDHERSNGSHNVVARKYAEDHLDKERVLEKFEIKLLASVEEAS
jgi:putative colanic acid biosynthesis glycosyltransferase WcaI